jgi:hypothetical protein
MLAAVHGDVLVEEMEITAGVGIAAFGFGPHLPTAAYNNFVITDTVSQSLSRR